MIAYRSHIVRSALAATALAGALAITTPAQAELLSVAQMARGVFIDQGQCAAIAETVWVHVRGHGFCVRYYTSNAGGAGAIPVVFLQGDKLGRLPGPGRDFDLAPNARDIDTNALRRMADAFSRDARTTAIYLGRPGIDGSSGHHNIRHSVLELEIVNAALEAIKQKHRYQAFHLAGQSGGGSLIGGLLAMRQDIACAVPGSGRLNRLSRPSQHPDIARRTFDAGHMIAHIARNRGARIIVVTDPADKQVPEPHQSTFVRQLRMAGRQVTQFFVNARDPKHHGVVAYARAAVAMCAQGAPDTRIQTALTLAQQKLFAQRNPGAEPGPFAQPVFPGATPPAYAPPTQTPPAYAQLTPPPAPHYPPAPAYPQAPPADPANPATQPPAYAQPYAPPAYGQQPAPAYGAPSQPRLAPRGPLAQAPAGGDARSDDVRPRQNAPYASRPPQAQPYQTNPQQAPQASAPRQAPMQTPDPLQPSAAERDARQSHPVRGAAAANGRPL